MTMGNKLVAMSADKSSTEGKQLDPFSQLTLERQM